MQGCAEPSWVSMKRSEPAMKIQICGGKTQNTLFFQHNNTAGNARGFLLMFSATDPSVPLLVATPGRPAGPTAKREASQGITMRLRSRDWWGAGCAGWEHRIGHQGGCLPRAAFHRLSHECDPWPAAAAPGRGQRDASWRFEASRW